MSRPAPTGEPLDPVAVRELYDRMSAIFADMMPVIVDQATRRCPYKDRSGRCTAQFGCRNQRHPPEGLGRRVCVGDDRLDYRSAWEAE
jgi:hypothetical protein